MSNSTNLLKLVIKVNFWKTYLPWRYLYKMTLDSLMDVDFGCMSHHHACNVLHWRYPRHAIKIMVTSSHGNIFRVTGPLCREFPGPRWIPRTKASDADVFAWCFLRSVAWINGWVNNCEAGDLKRNRSRYDVIVMLCEEKERNKMTKPFCQPLLSVLYDCLK